MSYGMEVLYASIGVALSVLRPFLAVLVKRYFPDGNGATGLASWSMAWPILRPYVILGLFSLVVAVLVAAAADFESRALAVLAGFAWDKTIQSVKSAIDP